jgi:hypothetical protein
MPLEGFIPLYLLQIRSVHGPLSNLTSKLPLPRIHSLPAARLASPPVVVAPPLTSATTVSGQARRVNAAAAPAATALPREVCDSRLRTMPLRAWAEAAALLARRTLRAVCVLCVTKRCWIS